MTEVGFPALRDQNGVFKDGHFPMTLSNNMGKHRVSTAMAYLAEADDAVPDHLPGGLEDDDRVVGAAVRAVLRPRRRVA